jgi:predicted phosphate transport protein (TIGR00153 family)
MSLIPKEVQFSDRFEELAEKIQEGGKLFLEILDDPNHSEVKVTRLKAIEHEADNIAHGIYQDLHKTFITPLDREDIFDLANKMDSILDMIESAATKMHLYKIKEPVPQIKELALILNRSVALVNKAVHAMRRRTKNVKLVLDTCIEINSLENEADCILRQSMAHLFEHEKDVIELIKCKEILERIEEATDICEDVSNILEGIILKYG